MSGDKTGSGKEKIQEKIHNRVVDNQTQPELLNIPPITSSLPVPGPLLPTATGSSSVVFKSHWKNGFQVRAEFAIDKYYAVVPAIKMTTKRGRYQELTNTKRLGPTATTSWSARTKKRGEYKHQHRILQRCDSTDNNKVNEN